MIRTIIPFTMLFVLFTIVLQGQPNSLTYFKTGTVSFDENIVAFEADAELTQEDVIDGYYYRYVNFDAIPSQENKDNLSASGLRFVEYIPNNTYLMGFPRNYNRTQLQQYGARGVAKEAVQNKLDQRILEGTLPDWSMNGDRLKVILLPHDLTSEQTFLARLSANGIQVNQDDNHFPFVYAEIDINTTIEVASLPFLKYLDIGPDPGEPEDTGGKTLQRANLLNRIGGPSYDGSGVNIMVRDDGAIGPHIDFEGRVSDFTGGALGGAHGDGVAGVWSSAGNLNPVNGGGAPGAQIYVLNYQAEFTDNTIQLHEDENVVITNSSYSNGCNAGYTATTQRVDQQMIDHPNLMHIFSAGNSNNNNCGYGAGPQWGNITGGHKQGKNVIAVANLFADGSLVETSSRGPAHDGRIKPDMAAHGEDQISNTTNNRYREFGGTSSSAPTLAASYTQLYQAFKELNSGQEPNAGFLKAVCMNTALDMGNRGPDFKFGWGRIDAFQGLKVLENQSYLSSSIANEDRNTHFLEIPENVDEVRVMLYWTDPAAAINANKALVNDLDLFLIDEDLVRYRPWVLNPTPNPTILDLPATRGIDNLNNVEQVVIENPESGTYRIRIEGSDIPVGPQDYYVVWSYHYNDIMVTYPIGGESFVAGGTERIHWDALGGDNGDFTLSYSLDGGSNWVTDTVLSGDQRLVEWEVPDVVTHNALVRISRDGQDVDISDSHFSIIGVPEALSFTDPCSSGATFQWDAVTGADEYLVYHLGEKYMEEIGRTSEEFFDITGVESGTNWFAVSAITNEGALGRRSNAVSMSVNPNLSNCPNTMTFNKTVDFSVAPVGDILTYTFDIQSFYTSEVTNLVIRDTLPVGASYLENSLTCPGNVAGDKIEIRRGSLAAEQSYSCSFSVLTSSILFTDLIEADDMESGPGNWSIDNLRGSNSWSQVTTKSNSPTHSWYTPLIGELSNLQALVSKEFQVIDGSILYFHHLYNTEPNWDGGVIEVQEVGTTPWIDLGPHFISNGYNSTLTTINDNEYLQGRQAFSGNSFGFIETTADLSIFAGKNIRIRFLFGQDTSENEEGWYIDDFIVANNDLVYITNQAFLTVDQEGMTLSSQTSTLITECINDCSTCDDGIQNGQETLIDCGGPVCAPCPCTELAASLEYMDEQVPGGTNVRIKSAITASGNVTTAPNETVRWQAGSRVVMNGPFQTGDNATLIINMEECQD